MRRLPVVLITLSLGLAAHAEHAYQTIAEGLEFPWSIAFLPEGDMLVTERTGRLRVIRDGTLLEEPVAGAPETYVAGQGGYFDVVLDPSFATNRRLYLAFAHGDARRNARYNLRLVANEGSSTTSK